MITILIPVKEGDLRLEETIKNYNNYFSEKKINYEIIVIYNSCNKFKGSHSEGRVKYYYLTKPGKGRALLRAFKYTKYNIIGFVDADNSAEPDQLYKIFNILQEKNYDVVIGSRWMKDSKIPLKQPLFRRILSRGFNFLIRHYLGLEFNDTQAGCKVFKKEVVQNVADKINDYYFAFDTCFLYEAHKINYKIKEVPIIWTNKGKSTFNLRSIFGMLNSVLKLKK